MTGTRELLLEFTRDKLEAYVQHVAGARVVSEYDANNTYQYIVNREETQLGWLQAALEELGETMPAEPPLPTRNEGAASKVFGADAAAADAFVGKWRSRLEQLGDARRRRMIQVILGETLEHQRFFAQALAGQIDLLGVRRAVGSRTGRVLPTRWIE